MKEAFGLPHYSFVLLCFNKWNLTKQAITTLIESLNPSYFKRGIELIIVNNGSEDETKYGLIKMERKYKDKLQIKIVHLDENIGYPVGINCGLEYCNGEIITIISNDLVFPENWLNGLVLAIENDHTIGAAVPYLTFASGPQHTGASFQSIAEMKVYAENFMESNRNTIFYLNRVIGAVMVIRKKVIDLIGGNDFWYGVGNYDDDDWSLRIRISGHRLALVGSSFVHHLGSMTYREDSNSYNSALEVNYQKYIKKWKLSSFDYFTKEKLIYETPLKHEEHFLPVKKEHFVEFERKMLTHSDKLKCLFVADWSSSQSSWRQKLAKLQTFELEGTTFYFWIPSNYFENKIIQKQISDIALNKDMDIVFINENIPTIHVLSFISEFDLFGNVDGDCVNRYLKRLAQQSSIEII
jgi:O-antigen biosynthesis protein